MTDEIAELVSLLDPDRDYGERSYDDVVDGIADGEIIIRPGHSLPMLAEAETGRKIKGAGQPVRPTDPQMWARSEYLKRAADDLDEAYAALMTEVRAGNMKAHQIYWGGLIGRATEPRETKIPQFLQELLQKASQPQLTERQITVETVENDD